jgi:hypothetical protein
MSRENSADPKETRATHWLKSLINPDEKTHGIKKIIWNGHGYKQSH